MTEIGETACDYCKERERNKAFLDEKVSQRKKIVLMSRFIKIERDKDGVLEITTNTPKNCFINGKDSLFDRIFQILIFGNTLNIPYGAIKEIWEDVSGEINMELRWTIVFDGGATRDDKKLRFEQNM